MSRSYSPFTAAALSCCLLLLACTPDPDPRDLLDKSFEKCQQVKFGYYEMEYSLKLLTSADTTRQSYHCHFEKLTDDSIYAASFHYRVFEADRYERDVMYTGREFVRYSETDSTGLYMSKENWDEEIESYSHNHTFYSPFTSTESYPIERDTLYAEDQLDYAYLGEKMHRGVRCHHVRISIPTPADTSEMTRVIRSENNYWISTEDYLPVQYTIAHDVLVNGDTLHQFERNLLTKFELDVVEKHSPIDLSIVPAHVTLERYDPKEAPRLLARGTPAPDWTTDVEETATDEPAKLTLLNFYHQSCNPCNEARTTLTDWHQRYADRGLRVMDMNTIDGADRVAATAFRDGAYPVYAAELDLARAYQVYNYPTLYLIDAEGNILRGQVGFDEEFAQGMQLLLDELL